MNFTTDIFTKFDQQWALLTAGTEDCFNNMTISWGGLGTLWGKPVATTYVRTSRYTHEFMDENAYFTLSFFGEEYKKLLGVLGSKSGRLMDKMKDTGLTFEALGEDKDIIVYKEAELTLICRKLIKQPLEPENMPPEILETFYKKDAPHDMYIGEVIEIRKKEG